MPHEDDPDGGDLSEISFTEPSEDDEGVEEALSNLSIGLRNLDIKDPAAPRHIDINVSSAPTRRLSQVPNPRGFQTCPLSEYEHEPTHTSGSSVERAPRGWSRAFPSRP